MTEEQKQAMADQASAAANAAIKKYRNADGWWRFLYLAAAIAAGAACFFLSSCTASISQSPDGAWNYTGIIILPTSK